MEKLLHVDIRQAKPFEADVLSEIAFRSKAYWGYDDEFMEKVRAELLVTEDEVQQNLFFVAETGGCLLGFYELTGEPPIGKLSSLFVDPNKIGQGLGKLLFKHAIKIGRKNGYQTLSIDSDPYAEGFYQAMGAVRVGVIPSGSIQNRTLPLMEFSLDEGTL